MFPMMGSRFGPGGKGRVGLVHWYKRARNPMNPVTTASVLGAGLVHVMVADLRVKLADILGGTSFIDDETPRLMCANVSPESIEKASITSFLMESSVEIPMLLLFRYTYHVIVVSECEITNEHGHWHTVKADAGVSLPDQSGNISIGKSFAHLSTS